MSTRALTPRVDRLEAVLAEFIQSTTRSLNQLSFEMKEFKDEMKEFKDEMKEFKDEMKEFKDEMKEFKQEMLVFKEETIKDRRNMNKQWGELANKMGTLIEDLISPAVRPVMTAYFGEPIESIAIHFRRFDKKTKLRGEFDCVAVSASYVFLVEVRSTPRKEYIRELIDEKIPEFKVLFPEFSHLKIIPVLGSLRFDEKFIPVATADNVFLMGFREWEYMDLINFQELTGKPGPDYKGEI